MISMKEHSVTITLTVRNMSGTIEKCVDSLINQNYKNKKIFVTDAFSTDGTFEKLEKYGNRIILERIKGNMSKAYNYMIKKVNTEFIAFTDADCTLDKNWLKILINSFEEDVIAVGGTVSTPKSANKLQTVIGKELESRYKRFPRFVKRLPTMNICVRTDIAKRIKFNENLDVVQETEWNYKLGKFGKIAFNPRARLVHYHRSSLKGYIKQQFRYGVFVPQVYLTKEHFGKITGDNISTSIMPLQLALILLIILSSLLTFLFDQLYQLTTLLLLVLFLSYIFDSLRITKDVSEIILLLFLFFLRNAIWFIGIAYGALKMLF